MGMGTVAVEALPKELRRTRDQKKHRSEDDPDREPGLALWPVQLAPRFAEQQEGSAQEDATEDR